MDQWNENNSTLNSWYIYIIMLMCYTWRRYIIIYLAQETIVLYKNNTSLIYRLQAWITEHDSQLKLNKWVYPIVLKLHFFKRVHNHILNSLSGHPDTTQSVWVTFVKLGERNGEWEQILAKFIVLLRNCSGLAALLLAHLGTHPHRQAVR